MSFVVSVIGGISMTVGALAAVRCLLMLTSSRTWSPLRAAARVRTVSTPRARRDVLSWLCFSTAVTINGMVSLLDVQNEVARLSASVALTALVIWQIRLMFMSRRQRQSAG